MSKFDKFKKWASDHDIEIITVCSVVCIATVTLVSAKLYNKEMENTRIAIEAAKAEIRRQLEEGEITTDEIVEQMLIIA